MYPERQYLRKTPNIILASSAPCPPPSERCSAGRSAYFSLNAIGARFRCHTSCHNPSSVQDTLFTVLLYGSELWYITRTDLIMIERVHRKILRTILGLPVRCNSKALLHIMGILSINALIHLRQLNFIYYHSLSLLRLFTP